jgi:sortase A
VTDDVAVPQPAQDSPDAAHAPEPTPPPVRRIDGWSVLHGAGEVLITLGCILLLFAVYELVWTNVTADRHESGVRHDLVQSFDDPSSAPSTNPGASPGTTSPPPRSTTPQPGDAFAVMYIPALGAHWAKAVVEGVDLSDLKGTIGHYPRTALPGQIGNFAVAGHRATNGQPLADVPDIVEGSLVYVRTGTAWYTYRVTRHQIVAPNAVEVLLPVPGKPGARPTQALITITTCNPRWASFERWIVSGVLIDTRAETEGPPSGLDVRG